MNLPEPHDPSSAMPDALARPFHSQLWTRLWEGIFPLLFFPLATLALYWAAMEIFTPEGGCATAGWYLDFAFDKSQPAIEDDQLGFGRARNSYYLIHNAVLAKKAPAPDPVDLSEMKFELGDAYETLVKVYLTHTFIGVGYRPRDIEEAEVGDRFADPPYHPFGFRSYARTLI